MKFNKIMTYAKPENSVYHGAIGAVRKPHLPGKCVSPKNISVIIEKQFSITERL